MPTSGADLGLALCAAGEIYGGAERHVLDLCRYAVSRSGRAPALFLFHDRELARRARDLGCRPVVLPALHRYDVRLGRRLADGLRAVGAQVVHAHGYKATIACALARRHWRGAVVKTEHGCPEPAPGSPLIWAKTRLNARLDAAATRRIVSMVCYVTEDMRRILAVAHRGTPGRVVPNGIEPLDRTSFPLPPELSSAAFHVVSLGRLAPVKGLAFALRALAEPNPLPGVHWHVLGEGPLAAELARLAESMGLAASVSFLGFRADALAFLAHADALLMPSLHEGLPYTLLEAMALGTPVLASRVGGLAEVIEHERTGLLFPVGNVAAIRAALVGLAADRNRAGAIAAAARQVQRSRYTLERMGEEYWRVYSAVWRAVEAAGGNQSVVIGEDAQ